MQSEIIKYILASQISIGRWLPFVCTVYRVFVVGLFRFAAR